MSKFSNQEVWGKLGSAIDMTKMQHLVWTEVSPGAFKNNKTQMIVSGAWGGTIQCTLEGEDVTIQGGELVGRLYKAAERSAVAHNKTYGQGELLIEHNILNGINNENINTDWWK
jgi:hypothetical protein